MSYTLPTRGSRTTATKTKVKKQSFSEVNVLGNTGDATDYSKYTIVKIKEMIDDRGISWKGCKLKTDFIGVLEAHDEEPASVALADEDKKPVMQVRVIVQSPADEDKKPAAMAKVRPSSQVNIKQESSIIAGKKRASDMIDVTGDDEDQEDYSQFTVVKLKEMIDGRGISVQGSKVKAEFIAVLEAHDRDPASSVPAKKQKKASDSTSSSAPVKKQTKAKKPKQPPYAMPVNIDYIDRNAKATGEKRLRPFEPFLNEAMSTKFWKARTEKLFMLSRNKGLDDDGGPMETFQIAGSTGSVYTIKFNKKPTCTCMDAMVGYKQKCKHVIYVKMNILKITGVLSYQLAFLSTELQQIFANAPATQLPLISHNVIEDESIYNGKRKAIDGDCPVCVMPLEEDGDLVWCKAACGQNIHKDCFDAWKEHSHGQLKCVYCRTPWLEASASASDPVSAMLASAPKIGSYKNIANHPMYKAKLEAEGDDEDYGF